MWKMWQYLNENYAKLRNYISKMKRLNQIFLQKGLFVATKEHLCLIKGHLDNPEGQMEVESPLMGTYLSFI